MDRPDQTLAYGSRTRRFMAGMRYALSGLPIVLGSPGLWPWYIAPMVLTAVLLTGGAVVAWFGIPWVLSWMYTPGPATHWALKLSWWLTVLLLRVGAFLTVGISLYFAAGFLAIPFNDRLSEKIETRLLGPYEEPWALTVLAWDIVVSIAHSLLSLVLWAAVMVLLFGLNFLPVIGSVLNFVGWIGATSMFLSREMMDACMSRRRMRFTHKAQVVFAHLPVMLGFGVVVMVALWIPFLNFVAMPMAVAAGTRLFCDLERQGLVPNEDGTMGFTSVRHRNNALGDMGPAEPTPPLPEPAHVVEHGPADPDPA